MKDTLRRFLASFQIAEVCSLWPAMPWTLRLLASVFQTAAGYHSWTAMLWPYDLNSNCRKLALVIRMKALGDFWLCHGLQWAVLQQKLWDDLWLHFGLRCALDDRCHPTTRLITSFRTLLSANLLYHLVARCHSLFDLSFEEQNLCTSFTELKFVIMNDRLSKQLCMLIIVTDCFLFNKVLGPCQ